MSTNYVIHQAIFIVSPDAEFPKHGVGATSQILYRSLFREYKCLFITHWDSKNLCEIIKKVNDQVFGRTSDNTAARSTMMNQENLTAEIDATMAAMEMAPSESDLEPLLRFLFSLLTSLVSRLALLTGLTSYYPSRMPYA